MKLGRFGWAAAALWLAAERPVRWAASAVELVLRHFWLAFVATTVVNGFAWRRRVQSRIDADPELEPGYRRLFLGYMIWFNLPWVLMGIGILSGQVEWIFDYLNPRGGNTIVLAWWGSMVGILCLGSVWMYALGGAEMLERHPGVYMVPPWSARSLRFAWAGAVAWNVVIGAILFSGILWSNSHTAPGSSSTSWLWMLFPVFFVAMWLLVTFLLSAIGGWRSLASKYAATAPFAGKKFRFRSAQFGGFVNYGSCLTLGSSPAGVYLAVLPFFRFAHPPLLIPWNELATQNSRNWFFSSVEFQPKGAPGVSFRLSLRLAEALFTAAGPEISLARAAQQGDEVGR